MFHSMEQTTTERTAAIVRAEVARHKLSNRDLSELLGRSRTTVWRRLNGEYPFDVEELAAIADRLGIPLGTFFAADAAA
jgi:transcriptional regulator with XRE-family HTH domain